MPTAAIKNNLMKKILLGLTYICVSLSAIAQSARQTSPQNAGSFDIIKNTAKGEEHINVNYVLQPAPFINYLNLHLDTPEPTMMTVKILNVNSEMVMNWMPAQKSTHYDNGFDISNLSAGTYRMEIYGPEGKVIKTVNFEKQSNTNSPVISK